MLPPSSFAREFRSHVVPELTAACELHALFMALDLQGYAEAHREIMAIAHDHRAGFLPEEHYAALVDWVSDTLLAQAVVKDASIAAHNKTVAPVHDDIERWNGAVTEAFTLA
jgi:hypothetical protein